MYDAEATENGVRMRLSSYGRVHSVSADLFDGREERSYSYSLGGLVQDLSDVK